MTTNHEKDCWVGFDLGGTKMFCTIYDAEFNPLGSKKKKTKGYEGVEAGLNRIVETIEKALKDSEVDRSRIAGIGVGCPGPLILDEGIIQEAPNLGWVDAPIKEHLRQAFECPVVIANDVDAGVYGESRFGAGQGARCVLGIFPGTGIGGGLVYEGNIFRGSVSSCMEIGHMQVMPEGPLCGCGQKGCLEAVGSRLVIASAAAAAAFRGQAPHLRKIAGTDLSDIRSGQLAESIQKGDQAVEAIVTQAAEHMGIAVASMVQLLAPDVIVLGGGLAEAMPELIVNTVRDTARNRVLDSYRDSFEVSVAKLGDYATALGAAAWARRSIENGNA